MTPESHPEFYTKLVTWLQKTKSEHKFSRNLANWVKHCKAFRVIRVWPKVYDPESWCADKDYHVRPANRYHDGHIILTNREGEFFFEKAGRFGDGGVDWHYKGQDLRSITCGGGSAGLPTRRASWMSGGFRKDDWNWEDITLAFWEAYMQVGKCLFDWRHTSYGSLRHYSDPALDNDRFRMKDPQTCQCKWCGDVLHLHRTLRVEIDTRTKWLHAQVKPGEATFRCTRCHRPHPVADMHQDVKAYTPPKTHKCPDGTTYVLREERRIKASRLCPSCFLQALTSNPDHRKALLPTEILTGKKVSPKPVG